MTFNCSECNMLLMWAENWTKGQRPLEAEVPREHTRERCEEIKKGVVKKGWDRRMCSVCNSIFQWNRKNPEYRNIKNLSVCTDCDI